MDGFRVVYGGDPWLANVAAASHALPQEAAQELVTREAHLRGISKKDFGIDESDTLLSLRDKLEFLDTLAGTAKHQATIGRIDQVFLETAVSMGERSGLDTGTAWDVLLFVCKHKKLEPDAAEAFIANAPHIEGFEASPDTNLKNEDVRLFLEQGFGSNLLLRAKVFGAVKTGEFLVRFSPYMGSSEAAAMDKAHELGLISREIMGFYAVAPNLDDYKKVEALLEGCNEENIRHTYRRRGISGSNDEIRPMLIANHSIEDLRAFDYFQDLRSMEEGQLRDLYVLGTVAHEVGHAILTPENFEAYQHVAASELSASGAAGVSDYAREYIDNARDPYNTGDMFAVEDLAETMRIFTCNAEWLRKNFPRRYDFIKQRYPTIVPDWAQHIVLYGAGH